MGQATATSWQVWKKVLKPIFSAGDYIGVSDDSMAEVVRYLGDFVNEKINPKSPEQRVFRDLWEVATPEEKKMMASLMIRGVRNM